MSFDTEIRLTAPARRPRNLLVEQQYDGHASVHDTDIADKLGLAGGPIEAPTHFSSFEPLAFALWGRRWYETGSISAHFSTMVVEGEEVTASLTGVPALGTARIEAVKNDGSRVLSGTVSVDPDAPTELSERLERARSTDPGELFIVDRVEVGMSGGPAVGAMVEMDTPNGSLYPFSLREKLDAITERSAWFDGDDTPWGRAILPFEMVSVLAAKPGTRLPVRGPAVGLFLDLEVKLVAGPLFVGEEYLIEREVLALGQSRRVESHWVRTTLNERASGRHVADVLLHSGVFKASYAEYPPDRL